MVADTTHVMAVIHLLGATYGHTFGREQTQAYVATLADLDGELLKAAALRFIENNVYQRIATPGELRQYAAEIVTGAQGLLAPAEAWGEVMRQLRTVGGWGSPGWSSPLIGQAVDAIGGWRYLCDIHVENVPADRARFISAYTELCKRRTQDMMQLPASERYRAQLAGQLQSEPLARLSDLARRMSMNRAPAQLTGGH